MCHPIDGTFVVRVGTPAPGHSLVLEGGFGMDSRGGLRYCLARLRRLHATDGLAITEYGLLVALVALALVAVLTVFGGGIANWFAARTGTITTN